MLAHFNAIERKFIAHLLLEIAEPENILKVALTSHAIKTYFTVDGLGKIFCKDKYHRDYVEILLSRWGCSCEDNKLR
jgi:hypothetical protein